MLKPADSGPPANETASASSGPSILQRMSRSSLDSNWDPGKGPVECLVIDHVEQPSED